MSLLAIVQALLEVVEPAPEEDMNPMTNDVGPEFFQTMGIPLLRGREITTADREDGKRVRPHGEVHLAHGEVVKPEREIRCRIGVRLLLRRQGDVETDARRPRLRRAAVRRLHDTGATAGDY